MRYGFTGTRALLPHHLERVNEVIDQLGDATEFTTGSSVGVDVLIASALRRLYPDIPRRIIFSDDEKYTDLDVRGWANEDEAELIQMPPGTDYNDYNGRILDFSEALIGFPLHEAALGETTGTWLTIRLAEQRGIPVRVVILEPLENAMAE